MNSIKGKWALVTGASSGIGKDIAADLAGRGANLILTARRRDRLDELAGELAKAHGIETGVVALDLSTRDAPRNLFAEIQKLGKPVSILVNNAGFGIKEHFATTPWERTEQMLQLNLMNLTHLTHLFANDMKNRGEGYILQVASVGAFQPTPHYAAYAASKVYVLNFGEAVNYELRGSGVSVTVLSPGATSTEFMEVAGHPSSRLADFVSMTSASVARIGVNAMLSRKATVVAGWRNKIAVFLGRFTPRAMATAFAGMAMNAGSDAAS